MGLETFSNEALDFIPDPDYLDNIINFIHTSDSFVVFEVIFFSCFFIYSLFFLTKGLLRMMFKTSSKQNLDRITDSIYAQEYDSNMSHPDALDYIRDKYGPNALDNVAGLVDKGLNFKQRLNDTMVELKQLLHLTELDIVDKTHIQEAVNRAGTLMLHADKEFTIFKNVLMLLSEQEPEYRDEYASILNLHAECLALENRIITLSLALITHSSNWE